LLTAAGSLRGENAGCRNKILMLTQFTTLINVRTCSVTRRALQVLIGFACVRIVQKAGWALGLFWLYRVAKMCFAL
jgi:hypothetical protein